MATIKLFDDVKALDIEIVSIGKAAQKLDARIHIAACSAVAIIAKSGDIGPINRLYLALGKGTRKSALSSWFLSYGKVDANVDADSKAGKPFVFSKEKTADLEGGIMDPWYNHKPDANPDEVFDAGKALAALLTKIDSAVKAGRTVKGISDDTLKALRAVSPVK